MMAQKQEAILITGSCGQIGTELCTALRERHGREAVIATDIHAPVGAFGDQGPYFQLNVLDKYELEKMICSMGITQVYHLAALLSANGEQSPAKAWQVNMEGLLNVLEVSRQENVKKIFWPSSIAVFGPDAPSSACPQEANLVPSTVYGISKAAGENWCHYYFKKYGLDVRSLRYPGLISYKTKPGGGTTDYAVDIFHQALAGGKYNCFLAGKTRLPMLYMPDAIRATLELMDAPAGRLSVRTAYNISGISFTPEEIAEAIRTHIPEFEITFSPDFRQQIAESWPGSIDDRRARQDWGWQPQYNLEELVSDMLLSLEGQTLINKL